MPIDTLCPGCQAKLRMGDEFAGQQARCPVCNEIYLVPELKKTSAPVAVPDVGNILPPAEIALPAQPTVSPTLPAESPAPMAAAAAPPPEPIPLPPPDGTQWYLRTPEGPIYGPVARETFDRWVQEGRVTSDCQVCAGDNLWHAAIDVFPQIAARVVEPVKPIAPESWTARHVPHRGTLILALGILSIITTCPIPGLIAWVMGSSDIIEMREGRMDPSGLGSTQAGRLLGMVFSLIYIVAAVVGMFFIMFIIAR